ncbi:MAG TPA: transposase [Acidobacteriaceae bacterium]|nr:transposase [Acidobacteriaceae bacterium]
MRLAEQELRTYFVTFSTAGRRRVFQVEANAALMMGTIEGYRNQGHFLLHAFVVMPDHVHVLITPAPDVSLEKAIQFIKGGFSFRLKSRFSVWERGHFDKRVPDKAAYEACIRYIHRNPVEAQIVSTEMEYMFSSAACQLNTDPMPGWFR